MSAYLTQFNANGDDGAGLAQLGTWTQKISRISLISRKSLDKKDKFWAPRGTYPESGPLVHYQGYLSETLIL